jgi:translocator protein
MSEWYSSLVKPALNPPSWVFSPVWTVLYIMMAVSAFLVLGKGWEKRNVKVALLLFAVQLVFNLLWSYIFFTRHSIGGALVDIILLWLAIVATIVAFYKISHPAAWLLTPYLLWVTFASYLNYQIYALN